ncbi:MAG: Lcl C-terminal domain-containing protein [Burkholderiales bacterium]
MRGVGNSVVPATGQTLCYDAAGREILCLSSGQDGELHTGRSWPQPRFAVRDESVLDRLTGLCWRRDADITRHPVSWDEALAAVAGLNLGASGELGPWRLPNINELESLVDCARHSPALPSGHPFEEVQAAYWSATTSAFEPDWAWALYLNQGTVGVGQKRGRHFRVWAVRDGVNDAPALAAADISIGSGSDVAKETGGIILVKNDVRDVVVGIRLSRATFRKIKQNLFWAFIYNSVAIPIAALGFLNPILAAAAMALSSLSVIVNSAMLKRMRLSTD